MLKLIHPKTGTVREVSETHQNKIRILRRGGFVDFDTYKPKKKPKVVPPPTLAEEVEEQKLDAVDQTDVADPVTAIHVSAAARKLIADNDLDAEFIEGSGKDGQIVKPDVVTYLEALAVGAKEAEIRIQKEEEAAKKAEMEEAQGKLIDELNAEERESEKEVAGSDLSTQEFSEDEFNIPHDPNSATDADGNPNPPAPEEEEAE